MAVNCWHIADTESDAMWRLHCPSGHGVAIRSSLGALQGALKGSEHDIRVGRIEYVDAVPEGGRTGNVFHNGLHKRRAFEHERELRAILFPIPAAIRGSLDATLGERVPVDLGALVGAVRVHPLAPTPFEATVAIVVERIASCPLSVERSGMLGRPYFGGPMF